MGSSCSLIGCTSSKSTPVMSIAKLDPDVEANKQKQRTRVQNTVQRSEAPMLVPGQLRRDKSVSKPRRINVQPRPQSAEERRAYISLEKERQRIMAMDTQLRCSNDNDDIESRFSRIYRETSPNHRPNLGRKTEGIPTDVRGSVPRRMKWKELYVNVMKPREQIMSIYNTTAAKCANPNPRGVLNVSPAVPDDLAERVEVRTPLPQRTERLKAMRARLKQKLRKPRLKKKDSTRRPTRGDWDIMSVISISDEDDEAEVILYSKDQDSKDSLSDENGDQESGDESEAVSLCRGLHILSAEDKKHQSRAAYTPESYTGARKSCTPTRKTSRASFSSELINNICRKTSSGDVEEVIVLPEKVARPAARPRRGNVLRNAFFRMSKASSRVHPLVVLEQPSTGGAWAERSNSGDSSKDHTAPSTPAAECQTKAHRVINVAPSATERNVTEEPSRVSRVPSRFRWSPEQRLARRFNAFDNSPWEF